MTDYVPKYIQIEIDERDRKKAVSLRFSKHHNRKHPYELQFYEEHAGITTIMLQKLERKKP